MPRPALATPGAALLAALLVLSPADARAHPHVFVDAGLELRFDPEGRLEALRVVWVYDDFISMLVLSDRGILPDANDSLTPAQEAELSGFDMMWDEGFAGDTHASHGDRALALGRPEGWTAQYEAGRIVSTHLRRLDPPLALDDLPLVVRAYDPEYYTAYMIAALPVFTGRADCTAQIFAPDLDAANSQLMAALDELSGAGADVELEFPRIGAAYAEEVRVTCGPR